MLTPFVMMAQSALNTTCEVTAVLWEGNVYIVISYCNFIFRGVILSKVQYIMVLVLVLIAYLPLPVTCTCPGVFDDDADTWPVGDIDNAVQSEMSKLQYSRLHMTVSGSKASAKHSKIVHSEL